MASNMLQLLEQFETSSTIHEFLEEVEALGNDSSEIESLFAQNIAAQEQQIRQLEDEIISELMTESGRFTTVIDNMDLSSSKLDKIEDLLCTFSSQLTDFIGNVTVLQKKSSESLQIMEKNKELHMLLSTFVNKLLVTPSIAKCIQKLQPPDPKFLEALTELKAKLYHADEPGFDDFPSAADSKRFIFELRTIAVEKAKLYIHSALAELIRRGSVAGTSMIEVQSHFFNQTHSLLQFLSSSNQLVVAQIRQTYIQNMGKLHNAQAQNYVNMLTKTPIKIISEKSVFHFLVEKGVPEHCLISIEAVGGSGGLQTQTWYSNILTSPTVTSPNTLTIDERSTEEDFDNRCTVLTAHHPGRSAKAEFPEVLFKEIVSVLFQSAFDEWKFQQRYFFSKDHSTNSPEERKGSSDGLLVDTKIATSNRELVFEQMGFAFEESDLIARQNLFNSVYQSTLMMIKSRLDKLLRENHDVVGLLLMWKIVKLFKHEASQKKFDMLNQILDGIEMQSISQLTKVLGQFNDIAHRVQNEEKEQHRISKNPFCTSNSIEKKIINADLVQLYTSMISQLAVLILAPPHDSNDSNCQILKELRVLIQNTQAFITIAAETRISDKRPAAALECLVYANDYQGKIEKILGALPSSDPSNISQTHKELVAMISRTMEWVVDKTNEVGETFAELMINKVRPNFTAIIRRMELLLDESENKADSIHTETLSDLRQLVDEHKKSWNGDLQAISTNISEMRRLVGDRDQDLLTNMLRLTLTKYLVFHSRLMSTAQNIVADDCLISSQMLMSVVNIIIQEFDKG